MLWAAQAIAAAPPTREQVLAAERAHAAQIEAQRNAAARAQAAAVEERRLADQRIAAATRLRGMEQQSTELADRVAVLALRRTEAQARLAEKAASLAPFLPVIQRLALYPAETLLATPLPPEQAVRGVLVLGGLTRQLEADAAAMRAEQAEVASLQAELDAAIPELQQREAAQAAEAASLDAAIAKTDTTRRTAEGEAAAAQRRAAAEAALATNLRAAIAKLEAAEAERKAQDERKAQEERRAEAQAAAAPAPQPLKRQEAAARAAGGFVAPVAGQIVRGFGDAMEVGTSTGLAYHVAPSARVVSPCGGRVVFAAPFRSFGLLAIIDCGGGFHAVLSGLQRIDATVGQTVQAGEPLGVMPAWDPLQLLRRPELQLEIRQNGQPVNPAPYLRARS